MAISFDKLVALLWLSSTIFQGQQATDPRVSTPEIRAVESQNYVGFSYLTPLPTLLSLPENASKDSIVVAHSIRPHHNIGGASKDPNAWLQELVVNSDAVVIGRPYNRISSLTAGKTFVFSDYELAVESVLKDKTGRISNSSQIVVSRPGGVVTYEEKSFRAIDPEFHLFKIGELYLLFLFRLPETGTYMVSAERAYHLQNGNVSSAKTNPDHALQSARQDDFISSIKIYLAKESPKRGEY